MQDASKVAVMTAAEYEEQYGEMMLNGLSSLGTYIPLRTNARMGINVAIRPMVFRADDQVVVFGGKLRVGYTLNPDKTPVKTKITALNDETAEDQLTQFCKGFSWQKQSCRRFSTIMGIGLAASKYDGEVALAKLVDDHLAFQFIDRLERTYKQYNDATFPSKRKAASALQDAWLLQAQNPQVFAPLPEAVQLPEDVVGTTSKVLNQAQDKYYDNVVSFKQKVAELAANVVEATDEESQE